MPRAKRTKVISAEASQTTPPEPQESPKCASCGHELDWRDRFYVPVPKPAEDAAATDAEAQAKPKRKKKAVKAPVAAAAVPTLCKRCHQRNWHARIGVVAFHPATRTVTQGKKTIEVAVTANRVTRRREAQQARLPLPPLQKTRRPTRAERRAAARAKVAQPAQASAA